VVLGDTVYRAAVRPVERQRFVVLYNESRLIERERTFLALLVGAAVLMIGLSAVAGSWLARRMTAPVTDLVKRVAGLRPEDAPDSLESEFKWDEVRELAHDFDIYLERLRAFIQRERLFTGDISHELRTPLAVSSGAVQILLSDDALPEAARERVGRIARAMREMQEITDALLALAREQDQGTASAEPCDVAQVMEDVLAKQRELFRGKPVQVELELAASPVVAAERPLLAVVLGNLLRNAFAYTDRGRIIVRLDACCVSIEDNGPGIAPEDRERVFRPYYRGARSSGAGLGLSLVRRICERYGWSIDLVPTASGGTRAELRFTGRRPPI
jgi:signal transduction histidine kinase